MRNVSDILPRVHEILEGRYGELSIIGGRGITKGQRLELQDSGAIIRCVIKVSSGGRISFARRSDGSWRGLSDSERVVIVAPTSLDGEKVVVGMYHQSVLLEAFEKAFEAQKLAGMAHLPVWLATFHEEGRGARGEGDGFAGKAMWTETASDLDVLVEDTSGDQLTFQTALANLRAVAAAEYPGMQIEVRLVL